MPPHDSNWGWERTASEVRAFGQDPTPDSLIPGPMLYPLSRMGQGSIFFILKGNSLFISGGLSLAKPFLRTINRVLSGQKPLKDGLGEFGHKGRSLSPPGSHTPRCTRGPLHIAAICHPDDHTLHRAHAPAMHPGPGPSEEGAAHSPLSPRSWLPGSRPSVAQPPPGPHRARVPLAETPGQEPRPRSRSLAGLSAGQYATPDSAGPWALTRPKYCFSSPLRRALSSHFSEKGGQLASSPLQSPARDLPTDHTPTSVLRQRGPGCAPLCPPTCASYRTSFLSHIDGVSILCPLP